MATTAAGRAIGALTLALLAPALAVAAPVPLPELPRAWVDTAPVTPDGRVIALEAGDDLAEALRDAERGDTITLAAGAVFRGPFVLPRKPGEGWIVIRSAALERLPPAGVRVSPADAAAMPVLEVGADRGAVLAAAPGASHYRLVGIELRPRAGEFVDNVIDLGSGARSLDELPHHIVIDRCYIHGDPAAGGRRGVALNSRDSAIVNSYLADFKEVGNDAQAIAGWSGPGPFKIANNYIEASTENILFGGAVALIPGLVPSDIEVRGNHFSKPLEWKIGHPRYAGTPWAVKNIFELKNARRVLIDANVFEHNWTHGQNGFSILFTVRNEGGAMPHATIEDVTFTNNVLRRVANGFNMLGRETNGAPSGRVSRVLIANNVFDEIGGDWGDGDLFMLLEGTDAVVIRDNTAHQTGSIVVSDGRPHTRFVFEGNVAPHNRYGIVGAGTAPGAQTLKVHFPGATVRDNAIDGVAVAGGPGADIGALCRALREHQRPPPSLPLCDEEA